jgi:hypothetical protein
MPQNVVVNFIGKNNLSKTTAVVNSELKKISTLASKAGKAIGSSFGLGSILSVAGLAKVLKDSAHAAVEDSKSKQQLALALKNTLGATTAVTTGAEKWIQTTSNAVAVLDDNLRPSLATAVRATGSLREAQSLLNTALDVSTGTGRDLQSVTVAISKGLNGNTGALKKLIPSLKAGGDWMGQLNKEFAGAAMNAANADPFQRLTVIFDNLKETIGYALLPYLQEMANYLASVEGQSQIQGVVDAFVDLAKAVGQTIKFLVQNASWLKIIVGGILGMVVAWKTVIGVIKVYQTVTLIATAITNGLKAAMLATGIGAMVVAVLALAAAWDAVAKYQKTYQEQMQFINAHNADPANKNNQWTDRIMQSPLFASMYDKWKAKKDKDTSLVTNYASGIDTAIDSGASKIKSTAEKFRDAVGLAFGTSGKDEYSVFNADKVINKLKRMVDASKGFADNLRKLRKQGAGVDVQNELIAMGPAQGNIVAKGLLGSGRLSEYLGLRGALYGTGSAVQGIANNTNEKTYKIEVKEQNATAQAIIDAIKAYEKKTGRKYFVTNG